MGNYYTGSVAFELKKDTDKIKVLESLMEYKHTDDNDFLKSEIGKSGLYERLNIDLGYKVGDQYYTEVENNTFDSYVVVINVCSKAFRDKHKDAMTLMLDYLRDDIVQSEDPIGQVYDEDSTFNKVYFTSKELENAFIERVSEIRKTVCTGCEWNNPEYYCEHYERCNAAFNRGARGR